MLGRSWKKEMGLIWRVFLRVGAKAGDCGNAFLGFVEGYSGTKCGCGTPFTFVNCWWDLILLVVEEILYLFIFFMWWVRRRFNIVQMLLIGSIYLPYDDGVTSPYPSLWGVLFLRFILLQSSFYFSSITLISIHWLKKKCLQQ